MTLKDFKERTSVRSFTDQKLTEAEIADLIDVINNSPTTNNSQPFSVILLTDEDSISVMSEANGSQEWIKQGAGFLVFLGDTTRNDHLIPRTSDEYILANTKDRLMIDTVIAATYAQDALIAMGFDSCFIGGLPREHKKIAEYLNLPETSYIVTGLVFGKAAKKNPPKPKVNKVYIDKYNINQAYREIEQYNKDMVKYYKTRGQDREFKDQLIQGSSANTRKGQEFVAAGKYIKFVDGKFLK